MHINFRWQYLLGPLSQIISQKNTKIPVWLEVSSDSCVLLCLQNPKEMYLKC